jgi:hypothetical protein
VQVARRQEDRLARLQGHSVEQQRRQHPGIPGIALTQLEHVLGLVGEIARTGTQIGDRPVQHHWHQHVEVGLRCGDPRREQRP